MNQNAPDKLRLFTLAANGKSHSIDVPVKSDVNLIEESRAALLKHGITGDELDNLILSPTELDDVPAAAAQAARLAVPAVATLDPSSYPAVPKPANKDDFPLQKSAEILVSTNDVAVCLYFWGKKGESHGSYMPVDSLPKGFTTKPPFPTPSKILYKRYWVNTGSYQLIGPQSFSKAITTTQGMSKTKTTTLSAELGVAVKGLSAKLSTTVSTSITITEETSVTETYSFDIKAGSTVVYTLWQLVEEFVLSDSASKPIEWSGRLIVGGIVSLPAKFKDNVFTNNSKRYVSDPVTFT